MSASAGRRGVREALTEAPSPKWAEPVLARLLGEAGLPEGLGPVGVARLGRVAGSSRIAGAWLCREPGLVCVLAEPGISRERTREEYASELAARPGPPEEPEDFLRRLRSVGRRELLRIVSREALALAPVEVTAREVSALAEAAVEAALSWAWGHLVARHGEPLGEDGEPNRACVLGMGKLGGSELNLSSDVDLLVLYRTGRGRTSGGPRGSTSPGDFFPRLVSLAADALGRVTEDGLVFRVDLDLRPEGRNGELAQPLENAVFYYQSWGQTWERAALMRARPIAGDRGLGECFLAQVEPFVYRRSLDYTTVEDIVDMKRRIEGHSARRLGGPGDLKLGTGGIREVEFFVQTLQLIHGGRLPEVRERNTLEALRKLAAAGVVEAAAAQDLSRCYRFLRTLEHAVQSLHLRRTHRLPADREELEVVARRMGYGGPSPTGPFLAALDRVRSEVHGYYGRLAQGASREWEEERGVAEARGLLALAPEDPAAHTALARAGFRDPVRALEGFALLRHGPPRGRPTPRARRVLTRVAPFLLNAACQCPDPDRALLRLGEFLSGSGAREGYLALLEENPATAKLLLTLFGTSDFLSRYLVGHPELLDELVLGSHAVREKSGGQLAAELSEAVGRTRDDEERLDALRRFRNAEFLRIALQDFAGGLEPEETGAQLTRVAEVCLEQACRDAMARLVRKYGPPEGAAGSEARFAVLGLGKLGGGEIDYHSDLDVLFVYQPPDGPAESPRAGLSASDFFARLAQRLIGALATRTREGIAFRMDARLRPSGQAGPLVTSLEAFEAYHRGGGGLTWERQALIRLRPVAGDPELGRQAREVVDRVLYGAPPASDPRPEIRGMRDRLEAEARRGSDGRVDLKAGSGGILDVEFAVQALQLLHGWSYPDVRSPNTLAALGALRRRRLVPDGEGRALAEGYRFLRRVEARLRILQERPTDVLPGEPERLRELARGLGRPEEDPTALQGDVDRQRRRVRTAYEALLGGVGG
ncbi:MAG: bifunctional [glutamate--ammonia ligase]-adenylyl-L-tyrosine phosphorylase/[glutamate--ammonia-ligase] adenylyltransferase [Deferrisomatales bacterium]